MPSQFPRYWGCGSHAEPKPRQSDLTTLRVGVLTFSEVLSGGVLKVPTLLRARRPSELLRHARSADRKSRNPRPHRKTTALGTENVVKKQMLWNYWATTIT
jgi:hypothetical protein